MVRDVVGSPNRRISAATAGRPNGEKSQDGNELRNEAEDHRLDSRPLDRLPRAATFSAANLFGYYAAVAPPWRVVSRELNPPPAGGRDITAREGGQ